MNVKYDQRLKRNVLEIEIEKDNYDDEVFLDQDRIARLEQRPGGWVPDQVQGQIWEDCCMV